MGTNSLDASVIKESEFNRFGLISIILLVVGCVGGVAVGLGAIKYTGTLILCVIPTMTTLSLLLAVAPMKWIWKSAVLSVAIDFILIIYFLLLEK
jgi:uncharacterized membrane protein YoaK (UPF0700 family)